MGNTNSTVKESYNGFPWPFGFHGAESISPNRPGKDMQAPSGFVTAPGEAFRQDQTVFVLWQMDLGTVGESRSHPVKAVEKPGMKIKS